MYFPSFNIFYDGIETNSFLCLSVLGFLNPFSLFVEDFRQMYQIVIDEGVRFGCLSALQTPLPEFFLQLDICIVESVRVAEYHYAIHDGEKSIDDRQHLTRLASGGHGTEGN